MSIEVVGDIHSNIEKIWKPAPGPQSTFVALPDEIFEGFYGGAAGGGKTDTLLMIPIVRGFYKHPKFHGIIFRRTFPQLEESLIARSKTGIGLNGPSYYDLGGRYNDQKHLWTFQSGAMIRFSHMERADDALEHDTAEFHYLGFDELTHFEERSYIYLTHRVRSSTPDLPAIVRSASNPGNIGHLWVRERFVEPCRMGYKPIRNTISKTISIFIPAKVHDNIYLLESDPGYVNRLNLLPEADRRAKLEGDWWTFFGQAFREFRTKRFDFEPENACHVVEPFEIPEWWPKVVAIDWGFDHACAIYWGAIAPDGVVFIYREYVERGKKIAEWAADARRLSQFDGNIKTWVIDPSAKQQRGHEQTIKEQAEEVLKTWLDEADNDRVGGKLLLHDFLRWNSRPKRYIPPEGFSEEKAQRIYRNFGTKAYHEYVALFQPEPDEVNLPKLRIFNTCTRLIDTIPLMSIDEKKPEDVQKFDGDDPYDSIRYLLKAASQWLDSAKRSDIEIKERRRALEHLQQTGDMTSYYIMLKALEAEKRKKVVQIQAFRNKRKGFYANGRR